MKLSEIPYEEMRVGRAGQIRERLEWLDWAIKAPRIACSVEVAIMCLAGPSGDHINPLNADSHRRIPFGGNEDRYEKITQIVRECLQSERVRLVAELESL